ncbi:ankyrin-3-like [Pomacea canaliculata]|uniref:ankyrin-3-like n=1 Tax=Pomacea canaliculata TaxID=400727 RepID=UPI000D72F127|nr:ankyrin-3-like [Pomacea canaliculata]
MASLELSQELNSKFTKIKIGRKKRTQTLAAAIDCGNWVIFRDLLCDEDVDVADVERCLVLHKLASTPDISLSFVEDIVDKILSHDVNINMTDENGDTAVMVAARCENWRVRVASDVPNLDVGGLSMTCFLLLLNYNTLDEDGLGVVHRLAQGGKKSHIFLLRKVRKSGGDINLQNADGNTATHVAVKNKKWNMAWVLLRRGARVDILNNDKYTVLHMLALYLRPATEKCTNIFSLLKPGCLNIDARDSRGNTTLQLAVKEGNTEVAEKLLNIGARADVLDENGGTVLHTMATQNHEYTSSLLKQAIACGAGLEMKNLEGNTALHVAAKLDNWDTVDKLIANDSVFLKAFQSLFSCIWRSNSDVGNVLEDLVKEGADVNTPDRFGCTVLQRLAQLDSEAHIVGVFGFLVNRGANRAVRTSVGDNLLHLAARNKHWRVVDQLLRRQFSAYEPDSEGYCVLHRLAEYRGKNLPALFRVLHNGWATNSARGPSGDTLLQLAAKHGNIPMVEYLVQEGAKTNINQLDSEGLSVIHQIAQCESEYRAGNLVSVVNLLLSKGANPRLRNLVGDTALNLAASHNNWNIVESLVESGCDLNQPDSKGFSILHRLAQREESFKYPSSEISLDTLFCMLLEKGANPFARSPRGETVLHMAAKHRKWTMVKRLVERGANINEPDSEGFYVLHRLVQDSDKNDEILELLVGKGANLNYKCPNIGTALHIALKGQRWSLAKKLVQLGADVNELDFEGLSVLHIIAAQKSVYYESRGRTSLIHLLITKGADVTARSPRGDSVFHLAARNDNWNVIEQILTHEPDGVENNKSTDSESEGLTIPFTLVTNNYRAMEKRCRHQHERSKGLTALQLALLGKQWEVVQFLLESGAHVDQNNPLKGKSPFHELAMDTSVGAVTARLVTERLVVHGINVNERDTQGDTPVNLAAKNGNWEVVRALLEHGADASLPDSQGWFVCHILAKDNSHLKLSGERLSCLLLLLTRNWFSSKPDRT